MTFAPPSLVTLGKHLVANGAVNLGVVGDAAHVGTGTSYGGTISATAGRWFETPPAMETVHRRDHLMAKSIRLRAPCSVEGCDRPSHGQGLCPPHEKRLMREGSTDRPIGLRLPTIEARFLAKVERTDVGCWRWTGAGKGNGYGIIAYQGRVVSAHRVAYELFVGPIPDGLVVDHLCHTADSDCPGAFACLHRRCVNPAHLVAVTTSENLRRGKGFVGRQSRQTHCIHGHVFDAENTRHHNGHRLCKACERVNNARRSGRVA